MEFTNNNWFQHDIINKFTVLTKRGTDTINDVITKKYQKYPSTKILKHTICLAKVNKSPYVCLLNMTTHGAYSITIHVRKMTILDISHKQKE